MSHKARRVLGIAVPLLTIWLAYDFYGKGHPLAAAINVIVSLWMLADEFILEPNEVRSEQTKSET